METTVTEQLLTDIYSKLGNMEAQNAQIISGIGDCLNVLNDISSGIILLFMVGLLAFLYKQFLVKKY